MNEWVLSVALISGVSLAGVAFSAFVLFRTRSMVCAAERRADAARQEQGAALETFRQALETLSGQVQNVHHETAMISPGIPPKLGLNLTRRSQALRMHRRGDPPDQIAASLGIPLQEVDLLLKVHRIVIKAI